MAGRLNLAVSALRWGDDIHATVQAMLPEGHEAEVTDIYPGGRVVYSNDPGEAQIFVTIRPVAGAERRNAAGWEAARDIPYCRPHRDLAVIAEFEGRTFVARTQIHCFRPAKAAMAAADPAALRHAIGLPPGARVEIGPPARPARVAAIHASNGP